MPYVQLDLDAKKKAMQVARAVGARPGDVLLGLIELWEFMAFGPGRERRNGVVSELLLTGFFGEAYGPALRDALVEWEFLKPTDCGFRVCGLEDRYTKADEARSRGGRAAAGNLIPGGPKAAKRAQKAATGTENARLTSADPRLDLGCSRASAEPSRAPAQRQPRLRLG